MSVFFVVVVEAGITVRECTALTNTECKCRDGFLPWVNDPTSCYCPNGSGLNGEGMEMNHITPNAICIKNMVS